MSSLPSTVPNFDARYPICVICQVEVWRTSPLMFDIPCGRHHQFHDVCLAAWFYRDGFRSCPVCREPILSSALEKLARCLWWQKFEEWAQRRPFATLRDTHFRVWMFDNVSRSYEDVLGYPPVTGRFDFPECDANAVVMEILKQVSRVHPYFDRLMRFVRNHHRCTPGCHEKNCAIEMSKT
jgi:hypothetical protein